ncbi:MAG: hypothetical protein H7246_12890, partial [Phycisphaerae bacterium]|nr:hypothetical protein [Saprospiraceae bacterium]
SRLNIAKKAHEKASQAERVSQGQLKITLRDRINHARNQVEETKHQLDEYKESYPNKPLDRKNHLLNSKLENFFNAYETACIMYFKENLNKRDFREEYREEIRDLVEAETFRRFFEPTTSRYQSMIRVYKEWEEKG